MDGVDADVERELASLAEEQEELLVTVDGLKQMLAQVCGQTRSKLNELQKLTKRVEELQKGKVKQVITTATKENDQGDSAVMMGIVPIEAEVERKEAAAIIPEEIWIMIIGQISETRDVQSLRSTCHLFEQILSNWKSGWLLGLTLPHIYRHLPRDKLLKPRLVCKSWKASLDNFLENHPSFRPHNRDKADPRRLDFVNPFKQAQIGVYEISFSSSTDPSIFDDPSYLEKWNGRLIGRTLTLTLGRNYAFDGRQVEEATRRNENADPGFQRMWHKIYKLLNSFGKQVWYLSIRFYLNDAEEDYVDSWEQKMFPFLTSDVFQIFPNLRKLGIDSRFQIFENEITPQMLPPPPKYLETLVCTNWDSLDTAMLRRYNFQIRKLHIIPGIWKKVNRLEWQNLTELYLDMISEKGDLQSLNVSKMPQLTKLGLEIVFEDKWLNFQNLLGVIRKLSSTTRLDTLRLGGEALQRISAGKIDPDYYSATSKVKTLEIERNPVGVRPRMFEFLLLPNVFPLLENLNVFIKNVHVSDGGSETEMGLEPETGFERKNSKLELIGQPEIVEVNTFMFDGDMYKSNIWEVMPLLKVFSFQWDVYTRNGYGESIRRSVK